MLWPKAVSQKKQKRHKMPEKIQIKFSDINEFKHANDDDDYCNRVADDDNDDADMQRVAKS